MCVNIHLLFHILKTINIILTRFACDGLKRQRLTSPLLKGKDGNLTPVSWEDALVTAAQMLDSTPSEQIAAVAGGFCDGEVSIISCPLTMCVSV